MDPIFFIGTVMVELFFDASPKRYNYETSIQLFVAFSIMRSLNMLILVGKERDMGGGGRGRDGQGSSCKGGMINFN